MSHSADAGGMNAKNMSMTVTETAEDTVNTMTAMAMNTMKCDKDQFCHHRQSEITNTIAKIRKRFM